MNKIKIRLTHNESSNETVEINIPEYEKVENIKYLILENLLEENYRESLHHIDFICRNIILNEDNLMEFYRLSSDDEIWAGRLEYFLTDDDVIVELFLIGWVPQLMHLVMKKWDPISRIGSIIKRVIGETDRIDMWNAHNGDSLEDTAIIGEMDWRGGYKKIIISLCEEMGFTFEQCRVLHDRYLIKTYGWMYDWKISCEVSPENSDNFKKSKSHFDENALQCLLAKSKSVESLFDMPESIRNSKLICCLFVLNRIFHIFEDHWRREYQKAVESNSDSKFGFTLVFRAILVASILEYFDNFQSNISIESMRDILSAASCWEFDEDKKGFIDYFLLLPRTNYLGGDKSFIREDWFTYFVAHRESSIIAWIPIYWQFKTILQAKKAISLQTAIPLNEIFPIQTGADEQPKDEDCLEIDEWQYGFEVVCRINGINMIEQVGQGGFGEVYLSEDVSKKNKFVLKICDEDPYREFRNLSRINRYITNSSFYGLYLNDDNTICMAMKYLSGGSLQSYLEKRNRLPEEEIARISRKLLEQIDIIHSENIIHRDIKTDNVVFDENHEPRLIDFGLSKDYEESQSEMLVKYSGNFDYKAPEIQLGEKYSTKIDIWSFGVMVIEMLTGKKPFRDIMWHYEMAMQVRETGKVQFEANFEISEELKEFIDLSMKPYPNERATAKELLISKFIMKYKNEVRK